MISLLIWQTLNKLAFMRCFWSQTFQNQIRITYNRLTQPLEASYLAPYFPSLYQSWSCKVKQKFICTPELVPNSASYQSGIAQVYQFTCMTQHETMASLNLMPVLKTGLWFQVALKTSSSLRSNETEGIRCRKFLFDVSNISRRHCTYNRRQFHV